MKKIGCLFICFFACVSFMNAQVKVRYNPSGEKLKELIQTKKSKVSSYLPVKILPTFNVD